MQIRLAAITLILALFSCRSSYVYNPAINLSPKPLEGGEINVSGSFGYMPETRPSGASALLRPSGAAAIRLGLSNRIMVQAEGWSDFSPETYFEQGGMAYSAQFILNDPSSETVYAIMPKYGYVLESGIMGEGTSISGHGFSLSGSVWLKNLKKLQPYFSLAGIYGFENWQGNYRINAEGEQQTPTGWALSIHGGLNYELNDWLNLNAELPIIYQYNQFDDMHYLIPAPIVGLSVDFKTW